MAKQSKKTEPGTDPKTTPTETTKAETPNATGYPDTWQGVVGLYKQLQQLYKPKRG